MRGSSRVDRASNQPVHSCPEQGSAVTIKCIDMARLNHVLDAHARGDDRQNSQVANGSAQALSALRRWGKSTLSFPGLGYLSIVIYGSK